ncbi:hypothetical protein [Myxosarcina sp. GI1]|uniref:hypothetical protein n=1 Tax=Myxosarcina sp. GI1 TaxID=1541065 RepID=UPI00068F84B9|nr:hypothetical protein [Myxosarcina sp. GI1]
MAIVVKHKKTGSEYILLAVNAVSGGSKVNLPSRFLNDLFPQNDTENYGLVTVCDARGNMFLSYIDDLIISEIDGQKPSEILPEIVVSSVSHEDREEFDDLEDESSIESGDCRRQRAERDREANASQANRAVISSDTAFSDDDFEDDEDWV